MNDSAPEAVRALLASRPKQQYLANLFTFTLLSGPVYRYTDWRRAVTVGGATWLPGPPRMQRGAIKLERGVTVDTHEIIAHEANAGFIAMAAQGYFRRALYQMDRVFAADATLQWTAPTAKFRGRINLITAITASSVTMTAKSMLDDLHNDYPRDVIEPDCNAVVFDAKCGLSAAAFLVAGTVAAGSTRNTLQSGLLSADGYFTQGVVTFTSGVLAGLSYMVKRYAGGVVTPAYPFLVAPTPGDTFTMRPGCDNTMATCLAKFNNLANFRGLPFVPEPTVTY